MPAWARFVTAAATGTLLAIGAAVGAAWWLYGGDEFWVELAGFAATDGFWWLAAQLLGLVAAALAGAAAWGTPIARNGFFTGLLTAAAYSLFQTGLHGASARGSWPETLLFAGGGALAGTLSGLLFEYL